MKLVLLLIALAVAGFGAWVGTFNVAPDEQAVVLRLGRYHRTLGPGAFQFHIPLVETYEKRSVTSTLDLEFGFRTQTETEAGEVEATTPEYAEVPDEKRMITVDENLIDVEFVVRYRIRNLRDYLFNLRDPARAIQAVAASEMRAVVATVSIDDLLTEGKGPVEAEALRRIRAVLDGYGAGIEIQGVQLQDVEPPDPVRDAFAEVTSSEQAGARIELEARGYAEKVVPEARGEAERLVNEAQAYRQERILRSRGEAERFDSIYEEYRKAPQVTRQRLYIETLEEILPRIEKFVMEQDASGQVLPYLPVGPRRAEP
ncbi:MAG: FtsH protease activity modulator HflK [Proteobacteria bacterium]|nr:FtsH protease activity modulator HflK [Pseudomonadota bacterium]